MLNFSATIAREVPMSPHTEPAGILRFGPFEFDPRSRELRKNGLRIRLQEQPLQVLSALLRHPGEVVTREELRSELWSAETFVDFDNGLNTVINKLREALGDSSMSPRFIETEPRRGYRFIAPVASDGQKAVVTAPPAAWQTRNRKILTFLSLIVIAGVLVTVAIWRWRHVTHLTEKDFIVLGDFANSTGDGVFNQTLRQGLSVQLEQSSFIKLISEEQIHETLLRMGEKTNTQLTPDIAREICQRSNGAVALNGSIALIGTRYDITLTATDCANADLLASAEAQAKDKSSVLDALGKVASEIRRKLGESSSSVQKYNAPLAQATTQSLEALRSFSLGDETLIQTGDFEASLPFYQHAIEIDPNFAMAYWALADAYSTSGETTSAAEYIRKAFQLRSGLSEWERLLIEGDYHYYATGNLTKTRQSFELSAKRYPREEYPHTVLADISNTIGQYDTGLHECLEAVRLSPYDSNLRRHLVLTYLLLNRIEDAEGAAKEAQAKNLDFSLTPVLYGVAFYRNDDGEMTRQAAGAGSKPGEEDLLLALEADTAAYFGHLKSARELSRRAAESAQRAGEKETAAGYYAVSALREGLFGDANRARQQAMIAVRHPGGRDTAYAVALSFAYAADANRAQQLADDLANRFPEDTITRFNYLPTLRGKLAISRSDTPQAFEVLRTAAPYELGLPAYSHYNWPNLYPIYVRGEAYLAAREGREAAAEFQKILDHRGIVINEPIGALAHLQLGRAYALLGDHVKAKSAYQDFLTLWKEADPDIGVLKQAKAEYAKLQ
jgi:DNA-binding winged helix-turn-helix (wHTH) protein/predicted Zn-dependent protease